MTQTSAALRLGDLRVGEKRRAGAELGQAEKPSVFRFGDHQAQASRGIEGAVGRIGSGNGDDLLDFAIRCDDFHCRAAVDGDMEASVGGEGHAVGADRASDA